MELDTLTNSTHVKPLMVKRTRFIFEEFNIIFVLKKETKTKTDRNKW